MYRHGDVIRNKYSGLTGVVVAFGNTSVLKAYVDGQKFIVALMPNGKEFILLADNPDYEVKDHVDFTTLFNRVEEISKMLT